MKLKIDDTVADAIIKAVLKEHMKILKKNVKKLSSLEQLEHFQKVDLQQDVVLLNAMKEVHNYFALPEELVE